MPMPNRLVSKRARSMYDRAMNHDYLGRPLEYDWYNEDKSGPPLPGSDPARMNGRNTVGVNVLEGSDMDMLRMYGPEDQVAFDQRGQPIPLADPRHPRNQMQSFQPMPVYPQQRR